ncbi:MAG: hypothetical protein NTV82_10365 [Candidatus Aminicenantes bacterium]|jgi:hypothetical protein|nr:hypothetical protein [Candidatus Aminicenantes bacterium]
MNSDAPQSYPQRKGMSRRGFIGASLSAVTGLGLFSRRALSTRVSPTPKSAAKIKEYRSLGRTGFKVSDISFGAGDLTNPPVLAAALDASGCANCPGHCEKTCPYGLPIQGLLIAADLRLRLA